MNGPVYGRFTGNARLRLRCQEMTPNHLATGNKHFITPFVVVLQFIRPPPLGSRINQQHHSKRCNNIYLSGGRLSSILIVSIWMPRKVSWQLGPCAAIGTPSSLQAVRVRCIAIVHSAVSGGPNNRKSSR